MITIKHHGAVTGVTGSCHELCIEETPGQLHAGILIDCGLFQGSEAKGQTSADNPGLDFPIEHIRALVVTHVHLDHIGRIPYLLAAGFSGPILCSEPSALLLPAMLEDALKIGFTRNRRMIEGVLEVIHSRIVPLPYGQWHRVFDLGEIGLAVRLQPAGHILGSAYVECQANTASTCERIVFSGDLGAPHAPLLPSPKPPERADRLVIEATYGDKNHESREHRRYRLKQVLEHALEDGGTVLIPAFSIGRTQDLLYEIDSLSDEFGSTPINPGTESQPGQRKLTWNQLEIVVDSPLAATFTELYRELKPYWDEEARGLLKQGRRHSGAQHTGAWPAQRVGRAGRHPVYHQRPGTPGRRLFRPRGAAGFAGVCGPDTRGAKGSPDCARRPRGQGGAGEAAARAGWRGGLGAFWGWRCGV